MRVVRLPQGRGSPIEPQPTVIAPRWTRVIDFRLSEDYQSFFERVNGFAPYKFQVAAANALATRRSLVVRAPTGAGKTLTILTPFFYPGWSPRPTRLIYAVPLRTLAQGIYQEARNLAREAGENPDEFVTMQTGEQPDDPFFTVGGRNRGVIITTYDQVLSGVLGGPYGLSPRLHNVNSAAMAGALVVFDEFHLMEPDRAFLTGAASLRLFRGLAQCVWMTATATSALTDVLASAVEAIDASPSDDEVKLLPTVADVERALVLESAPLTADAVLRESAGRTIVICNTVARAQAVYTEIEAALPGDVPLLMLHSRFFKPDRVSKTARLQDLFGKGQSARAVLVATQVIEAGIDISCDHLHTEICPMNSLVQRAGRCARYPGEHGTVHVYALPPTARAWLPYGDLRGPDPALPATDQLLAERSPNKQFIDPTVAAGWVERVHAASDHRSLMGGWQGRLNEITRVVEQNSIRRSPARVSQYIREESTDEVRVIVARSNDLPDRPGAKEAVTISRWQLRAAFGDDARQHGTPVAWSWDFGDRSRPARWEPLATEEELAGKFIICLSTEVAHYTTAQGLMVGPPGAEVSPDREEPRRPGYRPLRQETWAHHALAVARACGERASSDGVPGWLGDGFTRRFGISVDDLCTTSAVTGLLHDVGKLQGSWQRWAEAWQRSRDESYEHAVGLAHTDYDPDNPVERARSRGFQPPRPPHAAARAYAGLAMLPSLLNVNEDHVEVLESSCLGAILSHHGAWLPSALDLKVDRLWRRWEADIRGAGVADPGAETLGALLGLPNRRKELNDYLEVTVGPDNLATWWPLVSYLMRTLRLSDQRATSEGTEDD